MVRSGAPSISADGRFVAFDSLATNLVPGDTNGAIDVFVARSSRRGTTERVSVRTAAAQGDADSALPSISADGRFVAFYVLADQPASGDTNQRCRRLRPRPPDGHDRAGQRRRRRRPGDDCASIAAGDLGRRALRRLRVAATNLVPGDTNDLRDVFVRDRQTGTTERVSVGSGGAQGNAVSVDPAISADGRFVAFESGAATWCRATPTAGPTSSSATGRRARPSG